MRMNYRNMGKFSFSHTDRVKILVRIIEYYQIHLGNFGTLRSLEVLQEVFS
jgi:DNA repair protein RecO (recombination protein O)